MNSATHLKERSLNLQNRKKNIQAKIQKLEYDGHIVKNKNKSIIFQKAELVLHFCAGGT